jgi:hypothetical protein
LDGLISVPLLSLMPGPKASSTPSLLESTPPRYYQQIIHQRVLRKYPSPNGNSGDHRDHLLTPTPMRLGEVKRMKSFPSSPTLLIPSPTTPPI